jgi:50S ribosomal subunit-associated GTPase HflX
VLNKRDRLDEHAKARLAREFPDALLVSAKDRKDVLYVREQIVTFFDGAFVEREIFVPYTRHGLVRRVHEASAVVTERYDEEGTHLLVRGPAEALERLAAEVSEAK